MVARQPISLVRAAISVTIAALVLVAAGCGSDEQTTRFSDDKIIETLNLMLTSHEGNVGVIGVPPFAPDCRDKAEKQLNKLDPKPKAN